MTRAAFPSWGGGGGGGGGGGKEREICCGASPASPVQVDCSDVMPGCLEVVSQIVSRQATFPSGVFKWVDVIM